MVCLKAALLVHCSSIFIFMTFQLVVACLPISSADDSKCNRISSTVDCLILQKINDAIRWSDEWDLKFNVGKIPLVRFSKKGHIHLPYYEILDHGYNFLTLLKILAFTFLLTCHGRITYLSLWLRLTRCLVS